MNRLSTIAPKTGAVLIVVLIVALGLVSVTLLFGHSMMMNMRGTGNELAGRQADQAIEGAARYVQYLMTIAEKPGALPDITTYESEDVPLGEASIWFLGEPAYDDGTNVPVFGLVDECGKLNLNTATPAMLEALPGMTAELAAAIVDWRDADDDPSANGAESETYLRGASPYQSKNGKFETVEELALLNGADEFVLYGEDANLNGVLDANEDDGEKSAPSDNSDGKLDPGLVSYVTVYSREPNTRADGTPRVNVARGAAALPLLQETFGEERANAIAAALGDTTFQSVLQFFIASRMTVAEFDQISDAVTISNEPFIEGRINVNTASEAVLSVIPGIGPGKAPALVAARLARAEQETGIAWVAEVLEDTAATAGPWITGQTFQIGADVAAVGRHGRGYRRTRFVIDNTGETPRIIYRRNLAPLGWALGSNVRDLLALRKETR